MEECMVYLKKFAKSVSIDLQSFFQGTFEYKVSRSMTKELEAFFKKGVLVSDICLDKETGVFMLKTEFDILQKARQDKKDQEAKEQIIKVKRIDPEKENGIGQRFKNLFFGKWNENKSINEEDLNSDECNNEVQPECSSQLAKHNTQIESFNFTK